MRRRTPRRWGRSAWATAPVRRRIRSPPRAAARRRHRTSRRPRVQPIARRQGDHPERRRQREEHHHRAGERVAGSPSLPPGRWRGPTAAPWPLRSPFRPAPRGGEAHAADEQHREHGPRHEGTAVRVGELADQLLEGEEDHARLGQAARHAGVTLAGPWPWPRPPGLARSSSVRSRPGHLPSRRFEHRRSLDGEAAGAEGGPARDGATDPGGARGRRPPSPGPSAAPPRGAPAPGRTSARSASAPAPRTAPLRARRGSRTGRGAARAPSSGGCSPPCRRASPPAWPGGRGSSPTRSRPRRSRVDRCPRTARRRPGPAPGARAAVRVGSKSFVCSLPACRSSASGSGSAGRPARTAARRRSVRAPRTSARPRRGHAEREPAPHLERDGDARLGHAPAGRRRARKSCATAPGRTDRRARA